MAPILPDKCIPSIPARPFRVQKLDDWDAWAGRTSFIIIVCQCNDDNDQDKAYKKTKIQTNKDKDKLLQRLKG